MDNKDIIEELQKIVLDLWSIRGFVDDPQIGSKITNITKELNEIKKDIIL